MTDPSETPPPDAPRARARRAPMPTADRRSMIAIYGVIAALFAVFLVLLVLGFLLDAGQSSMRVLDTADLAAAAQRIQPGAPESAVVRMLGRPASRYEAQYDAAQWEYRDEGIVAMVGSDGRLTGLLDPKAVLGLQDRLQDGIDASELQTQLGEPDTIIPPGLRDVWVYRAATETGGPGPMFEVTLSATDRTVQATRLIAAPQS